MRNVLYKDSSLEVVHQRDKHPDLTHFFLHTHEQCELYFFISGDGEYIVEGTTYPLEPDTLLIMRPAEAHCLKINPNVPYERITVMFPPDFFKDIDPGLKLLQPFSDRKLGQNNMYANDETKPLEIGSELRRMIERAPDDPDDITLHIHASLFPVLYRIRMLFLNRTEHPQTSNDNIANQIVRYVNRHLTDPLSLDSLSRRFFLSKSQLNRIFIKATGESVWKYIVIKRLMDARAKIKSGMSASDVCASYDGWDYSAFYRAYKKRFGCSPKYDE